MGVGEETRDGRDEGIQVRGICKRIRSKILLEEACLDAEFGSCVGILGGNGSGKTTLLSILAGVQRCQKGAFLCGGVDLLTDDGARQRLVGYVPQGTALLPELTARDNLALWYTREELERSLDAGVLRMLGVHEFLKTPVSRMSGGMKKRVSIGCAVANDPAILLLDEPSAALDLVCKERICQYFLDFKKRGGVLLLATHDAQEIELCDKWYLLRDKTLAPYVFEGNLHRLAGQL